PARPGGWRAGLRAGLAGRGAAPGGVAAAEAPAGESRARAEARGDPHAEIEAARAREMTLVHPGDQEERLRLGDLVADRAEPLGQPLAAVIGHEWRVRAGGVTAGLAVVEAPAGATGGLAPRTPQPVGPRAG